MKDKLKELLSKCKCGIVLSINEHRNYYQSVSERLDDYKAMDEDLDGEIEKETEQKMIELDQFIEIRFYPDTPVGSYAIYHYSLDEALNEALACLEK